jgi:TolB-like protein/Tfp pilus assembly protein PilF
MRAPMLILHLRALGVLSLKNIARPTEAFLLRGLDASLHETLTTSSAPQPMLVVLPFNSPADNAEAVRLADEITDDLTTELSRFSGAAVVAGRARTHVVGERIDIRQAGRDLGARYVLHGSVRLSGEQVSINTRLVEAESAATVHADWFGATKASITANYDDPISRLIRMVRLALIADDGKRVGKRAGTEPELSALLAQGQAALLRPLSRETYATARHHFERALKIDPESVEAITGVAGVLISNMLDGWSGSPERDQERAEQLLNSAIARDPNNARTHAVRGLLRRIQMRLEDSQIEWEMAIALDPHNPLGFCQLGLALMCMGKLDAAIAKIEKGIWLTPQDPMSAIAYHLRGHCRLLRGDIDEAIDLFRRAHARNPGLYYNHSRWQRRSGSPVILTRRGGHWRKP